jgi:transposase
MTLHSQNDFSIPEETVRVARAAYPKGNPYLKLRDALGTIYQDHVFAHLFPDNGRPAQAPWRLAVITVLQFLEELPDRQAADAVRGRIDWKYLLGLPLDDAGFDFTVLSDFRARLVQGEAEQILLDALLTLFKEQGWLKERERQRTDSTHILAKVRAINRLMCVGETMRFALNSLAVVAGDWLLDHSDTAWLYRYGHRIASKRGGCPKARRVVWRWQKPLDKMAFACSATCLMKLRLRFSGKFLRSTSCDESGCRTIALMMVNCIGESPRTFLQQPSSSIRLTIKKPAMARNTARAGPDTRCI